MANNNQVVKKQIEDLERKVTAETAILNNMRSCKHELTSMEMQNTFAPKQKKRCVTCTAWLE